MNKLNTGFSKLSDNDFDNTAQAIVAALTGNANFPTPTPTLGTINGSIAAYQAALAMPDGQPRTAQVAATHGTLSKELEQLARNLELTPGVTDAMLATSGFAMRKIPTFTTEPVTAPGQRALESTPETQPQLQPVLLRLSTMISQVSHCECI